MSKRMVGARHLAREASIGRRAYVRSQGRHRWCEWYAGCGRLYLTKRRREMQIESLWNASLLARGEVGR